MLFFYIISVKLPKAEFGLISWASATTMTLTVVLSLGLELVVTRRVAASRSSWAAWAFMVHAIVSTLLLGIILFAWRYVASPGMEDHLYWLPMFFAVQGLAFLSTPLKAALNARENFAPYAIIAFLSNCMKVALALYWTAWSTWNVWIALYILGFCSLFEVAALAIYTIAKHPLTMQLRKRAYVLLVREAIPQFLTVLFDTSLARFSWILLGLLIADAVAVADYSFVYRAYEMAKMPVLAIGMLLLPRLSRIAARGSDQMARLSQTLGLVFEAEMIVAFALVVMGNIVWSPWVDALTNNRYGAVNEVSFLILSLCIPSQFAINLMWASLFAEKYYAQLSRITILTGVINLTASLILIPMLRGVGAALAFLIATLIQTGMYFHQMSRAGISLSVRPMFSCLLLAGASIAAVRFLPWPAITQVVGGTLIYVLGAVMTGMLRKQKIQALGGYLR